MKTSFRVIVALTGLLLTGCSKNGGAEVTRLNEAFPSASSVAPVAAESSVDTSAASPTDPNAYVNGAVAALKNNDQIGAVTLLNAAQKQPGLTAQQHIVVHETIEKVYSDLVVRAGRGDPKAQAALSKLEQQLSQ